MNKIAKNIRILITQECKKISKFNCEIEMKELKEQEIKKVELRETSNQYLVC